ncbi:hypothetical protein [Candidatus Viadribacter manganicus]|uniref:Uncharacterized protein n=1 Tax=Candidatus Viadribacter manganicus TaxID=1759059 RepID=A0A1B1AF09_9PROT|nr:hypothetical protein [Candidatus Viadribacter manganicus]ANP45131.1 hypothetical protein ATE48_03960 [Candidatus Viadribacter manganicus]
MEGAIPKLTADQLDADLKLSDRGAADGAKNIPASENTRLSAVEAMVVSRIEGAISQKSNEILGVGSGQDFTTLPQDLETLASEPQTILTNFRARKARAQAALGLELNAAQIDFARSYRDYRAFRIQHELTETEPCYDNVFWRKVFWLALLFVVEVAANGWMIGQASPGGLVQGWTTALMISVLVVLTGSLIGAGPWRYLNYRGADGRGSRHRIWAVPALVVGNSLLLLFAFYIAHYRYALSHSSLDAPAPDNILTSVMTQPFQPFQQLESLLLFVIALLIGIFAIHRGANWDDPYPGYGPRHRRMEEARERTQDIAQRLSSDIDEAKADADQALNQINVTSASAVGALRQAIARTQDNAAIWDFTAAEILAEGRDAIEIYRDANREARETRAPAYFDRDAFDDAEPPSSAEIIETLTTAFSRATSNITACKSQLAGARAQLEAEYHSFYDDELTPFLKNIENNATIAVRGEFANSKRAAPVTLEVAEPEEDEEAPAEAVSFRHRRRSR